MNSRNRSYVRAFAKPALSLVTVLVCLMIGEAVVRQMGKAPVVKSLQLADPDCVYKRSTNPILAFELKANYTNERPDFIDSYERTNAHGQRDRPRTIEKPPGVRRILLLGDSVVEGYGLPEEHTISRQLEELLADDTEVLNFGVSAYCTRAEIELLEVKGLRFDPDLVVLVFVENDFDNFNREAFPLGGTIPRPTMVSSLFQRSHLFRLACVRWNLFHYGIEFDPITWNKQAIGDNNVVEGLQRFSILAQENDFQPLIAIWPRFLDEKIVDVGQMEDRPEELIVERLARKYQISSIRLSRFFQQHRKRENRPVNPRLTYTRGDELHPSTFGAHIAALALQNALEELKAGTLAGLSDQPADLTDEARAAKQAQSLGADQPTYSRVHNRLGTDLLRQGKLEVAVAEFQRAIDEDPQNAGAFNNLGVAYERLSRDALAIEQFKRAIVLQPDFTHAHYNLARAFLRTGQTNLAIRGFEKTVEIDPDHVGALATLGRELGKQQRLDEAERYLKRAVSIDPEHSESHNNLGVVYGARGNMPAAISHFQQALAADPGNRRAKANLEAIRRQVE